MMGVSLLLLGLRVDLNGDGHGWSQRSRLSSFIDVTLFCVGCMPVPSALSVNKDLGLCRSSADLKPVQEAIKFLERATRL